VPNINPPCNPLLNKSVKKPSLKPYTVASKSSKQKYIYRNKAPYSTLPIWHYLTRQSPNPPITNIETRSPALTVDPLIVPEAHGQVILSLPPSPIHNDQTPMREELISIRLDNSNQKIVRVLTFPSQNFYTPWKPPIELPYRRSDHPFDISCTGDGLQSLLKFSSMPPSRTVAYLSISTSDNLTVNDLRNLLTHDSPINQQVINLYLQVLGNQFSIKCLDTAFSPTLQREGWAAVTRWFKNHRTTRQRRKTTPSVSGDGAIVIPCHVGSCHWVAVPRREINNKVVYLYADDMNHTSTEALIKRTLFSCDREFYPVHSKWISCVNYTFSPHSNECGIRTLLALSIFALHPNPTEHCLLPYMHHNLAQIGRAWIALAIMHSNIPYPPLHRVISDSGPVTDQIIQLSIPASIIPWPSATTIGYLHSSPLKRNRPASRSNLSSHLL